MIGTETLSKVVMGGISGAIDGLRGTPRSEARPAPHAVKVNVANAPEKHVCEGVAANLTPAEVVGLVAIVSVVTIAAIVLYQRGQSLTTMLT